MLACLLPSTLLAYERQGNPDRFPSVGLNWTSSKATGSYSESVAASVFAPTGYLASQGLNMSGKVLTADLRMPVSDRFTVYGSYSHLTINSSLPEVPYMGVPTGPQPIVGKSSNTSGNSFGVGVRYYIH